MEDKIKAKRKLCDKKLLNGNKRYLIIQF